MMQIYEKQLCPMAVFIPGLISAIALIKEKREVIILDISISYN
jgi:hypothetical protein